MTPLEKAKLRSAKADAELRTFLYDPSTVISRFFAPKSYRKADDKNP